MQDVWMPVRLIMNNRTLTVLEGTDYENQIHTFNLQTSKIYQTMERNNCFGVQEERPVRLNNQQQMTFCPFGVKTNGIEWVNEWDYDFNLFKYQCSTPKDSKDFDGGFSKKDENDLNNKLNQAKADLIKEKEIKMQKQAEEEEIRNSEEKINSMELEAIKKEFNLEEMIEKEESAREKMEEERIRAEIEKEREKRECLMKSIREKQKENQYNLMKEEQISELEEQKKKAKNDIVSKRSELNNKLADMKRRAARRLRKLRQELKSVKTSINDDVRGAYYRGGYDCTYSSHNEVYCKARFTKDPVKYGNCLRSLTNKEDWCNVCCQTEIGSMFPTDRHKCVSRCTFLPPTEGNGTYNPQERWFAALKVNDGKSMINNNAVISDAQNTSNMINSMASSHTSQMMQKSSSQQSFSSSHESSTSQTSSYGSSSQMSGSAFSASG